MIVKVVPTEDDVWTLTRVDGTYLDEISTKMDEEPHRPQPLVDIVSLKQTCFACPSQWDGLTSDGRDVYIRFRWGCLTVTLANRPGEDVFDGQLIYEWKGPDSDAGIMDQNELLEHLRGGGITYKGA